MSRLLLTYLGISLISVMAANAAPGPRDYAALCQENSSPLRSPRQIFKEHGLNIDNACPFQTKVDKGHECQDAASVLQSLHELLMEDRATTCAAASAAALQATRDCRSQESCISAQQTSLAKFQGALKIEISHMKEFNEQVNISLKYAVEEIAGGGVEMLHWVRIDRAKGDDGSQHFGPEGKGGAAGFVQANNNQDALERVFRNEDEEKARTVVQRFLKNGGRDSDISGLKSDLIREPLKVVQSGLDWKRELTAYQRDLESRSASISQQSDNLTAARRKMTNAAPESTDGKPPSTITSAPNPPAAGNSLSKGLENLGGIAGAAASAIGPLMKAAGSGSSGSGALHSEGLASLNNPGMPRSPSGEVSSANPELDPPSSLNPKEPPAKPDSKTGGTGTKTDGSISSSSGQTSSSLRGAIRIPAAGALPGSRAASAKPSGGAGAAGLGGGSLQGAGSAVGDPEVAQAVGFGLGQVNAGGSGGGESAFSGMAGAMSVAESNEKAVQNIVGDWEKSLNPDAASSGAAIPLSAEIPGVESPSLFSRVRVAHVRALKKGNVLRGIPSPL